MKNNDYIKQRLSHEDFVARGFAHKFPRDSDHVWGMKVADGTVAISLSYDQQTGCLNVDQYIAQSCGVLDGVPLVASDAEWRSSHTFIDRFIVYTPAELDFVLDRCSRVQRLINTSKPVLMPPSYARVGQFSDSIPPTE